MLPCRGTLRLHGSFDEEILLIPSWRWHSLRREGGYREADRWRAIWILRRLSDFDLLQARGFVADLELPFYDRMHSWPRKSDHEVRSTVIRAIEDHRVIAIQRGVGPARAAAGKGAPIELRRLVEQVERLGKLSLEGRQYELVVADDLGKVPSDRYQVVLQADARAVLEEMAKGAPAYADVLRQASAKIGKDWRTAVSQPEGLVLLRWAPDPSFAPKDDGPAITPSQMKGMLDACPEGLMSPSPPPPVLASVHQAGHLRVTSETVATAPADRARTTVGVGEEVRLTATSTSGTVSWSCSGKSTLSALSGASVTLTAHERAETAKVTATDTCGCKVTLTLNIIQPSGVQMVRAQGTGVWHTNGKSSVGIKANIYITPDTVTFENIQVSEDNCISAVTGYFVGTPLDGIQHSGHGAGQWVSVGAYVAGQGSQLLGQDTVQSGHCSFGAPYSVGTFDWPIPWLFRVGSGAGQRFTIVHQRFTINPAGDMTASKASATGSAKLDDPTSNY